MRNILFVYDYMHSLGGVQRVISLLSRQLSKEGYQLTLLSKRKPEEFKYEFFGRVAALPVPKKKSGFQWLLYERRLLKEIRQSDVVLDFRPRDVNDHIVCLLEKTNEIKKCVFCVSSSQVKRYLGWDDAWVSRYLRKAKAVVCLNEEMSKEIQCEYNVSNVVVIPNPIDIHEIESRKCEQVREGLAGQYVLASGRLHWVKGFDLLLRAYSGSLAKKRGLKLVILGEGEEKNNLENLARDLGIEDLVVFEGFVENPYKYGPRAKYFVLSSRCEGFGNVLIENLCVDVPVISFDCVSGPRTIVVNEGNGLLVPLYDRTELLNYDKNKMIRDSDVLALRHAIDYFEVNPQVLDAMRLRCRESVERFSLPRVLKKWAVLIER